MKPEETVNRERVRPEAAGQPAYEKPTVQLIGRIVEVTGGDDCGTLDLPIGNSGFGCALS